MRVCIQRYMLSGAQENLDDAALQMHTLTNKSDTHTNTQFTTGLLVTNYIINSDID